MGHAAQSYMVAYLLPQLLGLDPGDPRRVQLERLAARISINRVIAGVHFPIDAIPGRILGRVLCDYFVARCVTNRQVQPRACNASAMTGATEFDPQVVDWNDVGALLPFCETIGSPFLPVPYAASHVVRHLSAVGTDTGRHRDREQRPTDAELECPV